jgi:mono/diheme cytochrome c family protein
MVGRAQTPAVPVDAATNQLVWDALEKTVNAPGMTNWVYFTFQVTNRCDQSITVFSTQTSCDCAVAETSEKLPWEIAPGKGGSLEVRVNTKGHYGDMERQVAVVTSHGDQLLTVRMKIPLSAAPFNISARDRDVVAAKADRQAVFGGHCAACHAWPTSKLTGDGLFQTACGICHISDKRAPFVPDLFALKHPNEPEYWRGIIAHGKPGTLMPAFLDSESGILDTNQVESLVNYMMTNFPCRTSPPPKTKDYLLDP